eukprot:16434953-Heterocapsa_arctica.AAC.1
MLAGLWFTGPWTGLASSPGLMRSLIICPGSTGCSITPDLGLFRPAVNGLPSRWSESLAKSLLQYLHVPGAGHPVQVTPRSVGRLASFPQVVQSHLGLSSSTTLTGLLFAE